MSRRRKQPQGRHRPPKVISVPPGTIEQAAEKYKALGVPVAAVRDGVGLNPHDLPPALRNIVHKLERRRATQKRATLEAVERLLAEEPDHVALKAIHDNLSAEYATITDSSTAEQHALGFLLAMRAVQDTGQLTELDGWVF